MRLRWQLVASHLASLIAAAVLIGFVDLVLLLRGTRSAERQSLESTVQVVGLQLLEKLGQLERARSEIAAALPSRSAPPSSVEALSGLHRLLAVYRVERLEVFRGLHKEAEAYTWQRGAARHLATVWLPANPRLAAQVAGGQSVTWLQRSPGGTSSIKLCTALPTGSEGERRWLVLTEPLDGTLVGRVLPPQVVGALTGDQELLVAWPETPSGPAANVETLARFLQTDSFSRFFPPTRTERPVFQLDDGTTLTATLLAPPSTSVGSLIAGLRAWFLVSAAGALLAIALGSGLAARLLTPLRSLLEGTAAMARGHLMVRLPSGRSDELGALMREFNRMADEIRSTYLGVISTLAEVVEAKSHYTRKHIERVEQLTLATADVLERRGYVRFSVHHRFLLSVAAILHDVGKIAIDSEILNKSGPLDSDERERLATHPEVGAVIVERIGKLERAAEIIRCAHEHYDGSGYPRGLKGEEIPVESRIILAVDAFDAMTYDRPYSAGRPIEAAIRELRRLAGSQFDPVVVDAIAEVVSREEGWEDGPSSDSGLWRILQTESGKLEVVTRFTPDDQG